MANHSDSFVLRKVKNHPELRHLTEEEQTRRAIQLTNEDEVRCCFSYLLDIGSNLIWETAKESDDDGDEFLHTVELQAAHQKAKQDVAQTCHLPVKLILSKLRRGRPPLAHTWSSLFGFEYGPLHAALQVGEVLVEWGRESLVIPKFEAIVPGRELQVHVHGQGQWRDTAGQFVREMSIVDYSHGRKTEQKVDVLYRSVAEKAKLIENLVKVIVKYNCEYKYHLLKRNCQHFVQDAMAALGIKETPQFSGKLSEYYKLLKNGKMKMPKFNTHKCVDEYVMENFKRLSQHDMEFLLCQYFLHHYDEMSKTDNVDEWRCTIATCQSDRLEDRIKQDSLLFNQFHPDAPPPPLPPRANRQRKKATTNSSDKRGSKVAEMHIEQRPMRAQPQLVVRSEGPRGLEDKDNAYVEEKLPQEFMRGVSLQRQDSFLGKCSGYRDCIEFKLRTIPDYMNSSQPELDSTVNTLGEQAYFRAAYFEDNLCTCQDIVRKMVDDLEHVQFLTTNKAQDRARKNFATLCRFPLKLLFHPVAQFDRGNVQDVPSEVGLQIGQYELEWNIAGLVIPKQVQAKHCQPVLSVCPTDSKWSAFVCQKMAKVNEAIQKMDLALQTQLMFELVQKRDELMAAMIEVIVDYNRHKEYDEKKLANRHFIEDVCKAVGIPPTAIVESVQQFNGSQYATRHFSSHMDLDNFVIDLNWENKTASLPQIDIQYLITRYFHFHVVDWERMEKPEHWTCDMQNCQLLELEKLIH